MEVVETKAGDEVRREERGTKTGLPVATRGNI